MSETTVQKHEANKSYLTPSGNVLKWLTKIHIAVYRMSFGLIGHAIYQLAEKGAGFFVRRMDCLLITSTGRKSGLERTAVLPYFKYDNRVFIVGSNAAQKKHPAWVHNITAKPEVRVMIGSRKSHARAVPLTGADYDTYWKKHADNWPRYAIYQQKTDRQIPLVEIILE